MRPSFNIQMLTNVLASALTSTFTAWLSYLAAWSHFSSSDNTALATVLAAGASTLIGVGVTVLLNRTSVIADSVAQGGNKVVLADQKMADSIQNTSVLGPQDAAVVNK